MQEAKDPEPPVKPPSQLRCQPQVLEATASATTAAWPPDQERKGLQYAASKGVPASTICGRSAAHCNESRPSGTFRDREGIQRFKCRVGVLPVHLLHVPHRAGLVFRHKLFEMRHCGKRIFTCNEKAQVRDPVIDHSSAH